MKESRGALVVGPRISPILKLNQGILHLSLTFTGDLQIMPYTTNDIRNIALVGQAGAGKTSLIEALLFGAGTVGTQGSVEKGDTVCDYDPLEKRHHHSLNAAVVGIDYRGRHINLIDTPGDPDFLGQALSTLAAVETVAIVINAQSGIEPVTRRMMEQAAKLHQSCMIIVNKIDADPDHLANLMHQIRNVFGKECLALNLPASHASRIVDCLNEDSGDTDFSSASEAHTALLDQVVEVDEDVMERYLEQGEVSPNELHGPFEKALRDGHLIPVCFVSARTGTGISELLEVFAELAPSPLEGGVHEFANGKLKAGPVIPYPDPSAPLLAHVFKVEYDPFVGKIGLMRVHRGTLHKGDQLLVDDGQRTFKIGHLYRLQGKQHIELDDSVAGDICAVAKVDALHQDAVLHSTHDDDELRASTVDLPMPLVGVALKAKSRGDEQKLSDALHRLVDEDPCLRIEHNRATNETVLRGLGDFHLRVALEKLTGRSNIEVDTHPPSVPYRETVTRVAKGHHRHKKQTGGAGQFGEVHLEIEPLDRGTGFEFVNRITGGVIPAQFIPAIEKGVRQVLEAGPVAGYPMQDLRVTVYDGKHHAVDSKEVAFVAAGKKAFIDAVNNAGAILLEPVVDLEVVTPTAAVGGITGDLASRRARIGQSGAGGNGEVTITAKVPLAELEDYDARFKSLTGGEGGYRMVFSHYESAPPNIQKKLMENARSH